ncbi:hypothetical protein [Maricaulis sp. CAU 1757]
MIQFTALSLLLALTGQTAPPADIGVAPRSEFQSPEARLNDRLEALAEAETAREAAPLIDEIHALWAHSGSQTVALMMDRGRAAEQAGNHDIAARMFGHVIQLAPDYAEGWLAAGRQAARAEDWAFALETLNTALTLEPRRYDAYLAVARVLERAEAWEAALDAYRQVLDIHPTHEAAREAVERLERAGRGRSL